jgi:hypothetical protein
MAKYGARRELDSTKVLIVPVVVEVEVVVVIMLEVHCRL